MTNAGGEALRLALLLESDGPGGAETVLLLLAEEMRARGHAVMPVGPANGSGWLAARFRERGFQPATFSIRRPLDWRCLRGLAALLLEHRIDVVHSHEFTMAVYGAAAARSVGARHVITMHGGRYYAEQWRRRAALRWAARHSAAVAAVSRSTADDLRRTLRLPDDRVVVVPNGIPFSRGDRARVRYELMLHDDAGELLLVAVGNLYPVKGHRVLLQALALLPSDAALPPWRLVICGRGEEEGPLRALAAELGIAERVHLLGLRSDVADVLAAGDLYVMPSLSEGLPLALVEAMAAGLPIVASNVGGIPEVVADGIEAVLTPADDAPALAGAIGALLGDASRRGRMGTAARARARRDFDVRAMGDAYERLYRGAPPLAHDAGTVRGIASTHR